MVSVDVDVRPHPPELVDEGETGLEDVLGAAAHAVRLREEDHHLWLQVGGEPRVRERDDVDRTERLRAPLDRHGVALDEHRRPRGLQLAQREGQIVGPDPLDADAAARERTRDEVGAGLDAVGTRLPPDPCQALDPLHHHRMGPDT